MKSSLFLNLAFLVLGAGAAYLIMLLGKPMMTNPPEPIQMDSISPPPLVYESEYLETSKQIYQGTQDSLRSVFFVDSTAVGYFLVCEGDSTWVKKVTKVDGVYKSGDSTFIFHGSRLYVETSSGIKLYTK